MKKYELRKGLAIGIIVLFIGAVILPSIGGVEIIEETGHLENFILVDTFYPTDDAYIKHTVPDANLGDFEYFRVRNEYGAPGAGHEYSGLIKFDVSSVPPCDFTATLYIFYVDYNAINPAGRAIRLFRATSDWDEMTVTWNTQPPYATQASALSIVPSSAGWMLWDVTSDIQDFVSGQETNYGWKVTDDNYWGGYDIPNGRFRTKEYGSLSPYIEVEIEVTSDPPYKPTIDGPPNGKIGVSYVYTANTTDPDGDKMNYLFDWGDETDSGWVGPYDSGATAYGSHIWTTEGTFIVRVKASDIHGAVSDWSEPLLVTMPVNQHSSSFPLLQRLLERFPNMFPILRNLLEVQC